MGFGLIAFSVGRMIVALRELLEVLLQKSWWPWPPAIIRTKYVQGRTWLYLSPNSLTSSGQPRIAC
jgi:hypothetical protein